MRVITETLSIHLSVTIFSRNQRTIATSLVWVFLADWDCGDIHHIFVYNTIQTPWFRTLLPCNFLATPSYSTNYKTIPKYSTFFVIFNFIFEVWIESLFLFFFIYAKRLPKINFYWKLGRTNSILITFLLVNFRSECCQKHRRVIKSLGYLSVQSSLNFWTKNLLTTNNLTPI